MTSNLNCPNLTSAGTPVPDFKERSKEEIEEYAWRMKVYVEEIMPIQYPNIIKKHVEDTSLFDGFQF